ncbi:A/G-specific adenine glycosylase [Breoghania sp.]|uniref:A/G-specific adenine glycosylase n=1 Tax=Breoghania sp. TaxID=2065378 RepID=UPI0029C7BB98|nr:A/G-specific adenine glycosylase [Breoghania sp.]
MDTQTLRRRLLSWYAAHRRRLPWRETSDPYAIWVSEVMLQQTRVDTAIAYYLRFMKRFPTVSLLARADLQEVLKLWEGLGYYSRARNLHRAAGIVVARFNGAVPDDPAAFRSLSGVGEYIAAAVLSIAFNQSLPVVDGNVKRVLARLLEIDFPVNRSGSHKIFLEPAGELICPKQPADYNQAIMELGALVCRPKNPDCGGCPLAEQCGARQNGRTACYPKRDPSKTVPHRRLAIAVILKKGKMLVVQRRLEGFLGGLWEFPAVPVDSGSTATAGVESKLKAETGLTVLVERRLTRIRHAYTHFKITGEVFLCRYAAGRVRLASARRHRWISFGTLTDLPLHKANHKFLDALKAALKK